MLKSMWFWEKSDDMSEKLAAVEQFLKCSICLETFEDPVSLSCDHNFCSKCLQEFWGQNESKNCPVCERKPSKEVLEVNFGLKQLADSFAGRQKSGSLETVGEVKVELVCGKHKDEVKMFCEDEQKVVCSVCEFSLHQGHKVVPVEEAARELKEQLESDLAALKNKKEKCGEVEGKYQQVIQHSYKQVSFTFKQISAEFDELHDFLEEEEKCRVDALREEEEQKRKTVSSEMEKVQQQMSSLSSSITAVEEALQKEPVAFLNSYKASQSSARDQCSQSDPQLVPGALIDVAKHLGNLSFNVWQKMKDEVHFRPVILDPNTASSWLHLSDDLTSVRYGEPVQKLPDNPERNHRCAILASEGFSSGKHSWEVEVGDHPNWDVGVAKESVDRKGERNASTDTALWFISNRNGKYTNVFGDTVAVRKNLKRIGVKLDFDMERLSFYDAADDTYICQCVDTFNEKLFPYLSISSDGNKKAADVKICEMDFFVTFEDDEDLEVKH